MTLPLHATPADYIEWTGTRLLLKHEFRNPTGSIKDRVADWFIRDITAKLSAHDKRTLVVPSTGNLAIALAALSRQHSYRVAAVVPESTSIDRVQLLKAQGVELIRTPSAVRSNSDEGCFAVARRIAEKLPHAVVIDESSDAFRPAECYRALAAELLVDAEQRMDVLVVGVESGGTINGLGRLLRAQCPGLRVVGVLPEGADLTGKSEHINKRPWKVEDIGTDTATLHISNAQVDTWMHVSDKDAYSTARQLIRDHGILCGPSSGAAVYAAAQYVQAQGLADARVTVLLNDSALHYASTLLNDEWLMAHNFANTWLLEVLQREVFEKYRGASVEDLQLAAAVTVRDGANIMDALEQMGEREFSQLPVVDGQRKMIGFVYDADLQAALEAGRAAPNDPVSRWMHHFNARGPRAVGQQRTYQLITPATPLVELARFFEQHSAAFVTDEQRRWCLGVATKYDLIRFASGRGRPM